MSSARSPLAPAGFPNLPVIEGVRFASIGVGVKYKNRADVMLAELAVANQPCQPGRNREEQI